MIKKQNNETTTPFTENLYKTKNQSCEKCRYTHTFSPHTCTHANTSSKCSHKNHLNEREDGDNDDDEEEERQHQQNGFLILLLKTMLCVFATIYDVICMRT